MRTQTGRSVLLKPELKHWDCADHDPIENWVPDDAAVIYWLTLGIGLSHSEAADNFQVCVGTPGGLKSAAGRLAKPRGSGYPASIVLQDYSWAGVVTAVQARLDNCVGRDWLEVLQKLRQHFLWEYEGDGTAQPKLDPRVRIVTQLPLDELWDMAGQLHASRVRSLVREDLRALLRSGPVRFVVADVGTQLRWVDPEETFNFWKREALPRIADAEAFFLEDFPDRVAYVASLWKVAGEGAMVVLLEARH
jgi:hypothetical protein